jgi:hypothetical protein
MSNLEENRVGTAHRYIYDLLQLNIDISMDSSLEIVDREEIIKLLSDTISILNYYE